MDLNLKKFENINARQEDRITVTGTRSFGFPTKFYRDNNIDKYKYVVIYYDDGNKAVGFYFTNDEGEKHKFTIIKSRQGYGGTVVATSFFKTYNLDPKTYRGRYDWQERNLEGIGKLLVIRLKERSKKED